MINEKLLSALRDQINQEFYSAYLYLSMSLKMEETNYKGYANWLLKQYQEELSHAQEFINYVQKRGCTVQLNDIKAAHSDTISPLDTAKAVLKHEESITASICNLTRIAREVNDYATEIFLHKFINEQIEEEDSARNIVDRFTLAGDNIAARYAIDNELGDRQA